MFIVFVDVQGLYCPAFFYKEFIILSPLPLTPSSKLDFPFARRKGSRHIAASCPSACLLSGFGVLDMYGEHMPEPVGVHPPARDRLSVLRAPCFLNANGLYAQDKAKIEEEQRTSMKLIELAAAEE